jgi:hypothetical protein
MVLAKTATIMETKRLYSNDEVIIDVTFQEANADSESKTPLGLKIAFLFIISLVFFVICLLIDNIAYGSRYFNHFKLEKCDCSLALPKNISIVSDGEVYSVKRESETYGVQYIWHHRSWDWMYPDITKGNVFIDSCDAKSAYFEYVKQSKNTMKDFR